MSVNLRDKLRQYIALNNYVSAYRSDRIIPQEYIPLEYIESTGTQYIDTGIKPTVDTSITATMSTSDISTGPTFFGAISNKVGLLVSTRSNGNGTVYLNGTDNAAIISNYTIEEDSIYKITVYNNKFIVSKDNGSPETRTGTTSITANNYNIIIIGRNNAGTIERLGNFKIYEFSIYQNNSLVRNYTPVKNIKTGEIGLYDYITNTLYTSASQDPFIAGPELNNSELNLTDAIHDGLEDLTLYGASKTVSTEYLNTVNANGNSLMQGRDLPLEYTQVEYAKKKGTAGVQGKFDTGIKPTADDVKIEMKVKIGDEAQASGQTTVGSFYACQSRATASSEITGISGSATGATILGLQNAQSVASGIVRVKDHIDLIRYEYKNGNHSIYVKDLTTNTEDTQTGTYTFAAPTKNLYIFGNTTATNALNNNNAIYYCKIWVSGSLAFDAVPVIRNSDNVVGLYDKVSETFIVPIITEGGGFEAGDAATPTPSDPMDIYDNNGILTPYLDAEGSSTQSGTPTPTAPIDMINYKQGLVELRRVGAYKDTLTHGSANATITRNVGVKVFDGTEDFALVSGNTDIFRTPNNAVYPSDFASNPDSNVGLCNNYKIVSTSTSLASNIQDGEMGWNTNGALTVRDSRFTTAAQFKAWLAQMYIEGTPVVVYYPLATPTTESILPAYGAQITRDYEQLEYIGATGTQYIETDLSGPMRWVGAGQGTSEGTGSQCILSCLLLNGSLERNANYFVGSQVLSNKYWAINTNSGGNSGISTVPTLNYAEYDIMFTGNQESYGKINNDYLRYKYSGSAVWTYNEWYIGVGLGANNTEYYFTGNIYEQKAYKNGVLVGDFIPAKRKSDGVIGMYDAVSGTFYTNAGTGDFTAGPSMYRNLANVATDIDGKYIAEDGSIGTSATSCYSAIIPVVAGETYVWSCMCGNSGQKNNKRVHAYVDGVWNQQIFLEEVSANTAWSKSFTVPAGCNGIRISHWNTDTDTQVELGSTKTSYVPYKIQKYIINVKPETLQDARNYTATCQDLLYVNNTRDTQEILSGNINRNCRIAVFDGSETGWMRHSTYYWFYDTEARFDFPGSMEPVLCSSLPNLPAGQAQGQQGQFVSVGHSNGTTYRIIIANNFDSSVTVADFKAWLEQKYYEGDPVIVVYKATTPTTETVDAQLMKKAPVEITQTALADATVDVVNKTVSEQSPDYPLDIACNNGLVQYNRVYTGKWKLIKNPTQQSNKAIYIKASDSTWTALSDRGAGAVIPLRVGDTYKITFNYNSLMYNNFIRYGEVDDSTPPVGQYKPVYNLQVVSSITNSFTYTFTAGHPYLAIQATATTVENGRLEEAFVIENITSSLPASAISPLAYTGYEELEYVEGTTTGSTGSYIDTGIKPTQNTKVEVKFSVNELGANQCVIGGRNASSGDQRNSFSIWGNVSNKIRFDYQSTSILYPSTSAAISANTVYTVIKDKEKNYVDGVQQNSNDITTFTSNYSMFLFAVNSGVSGSQSCLSGKIYYCKIWDNDILVRDFIPVKRLSDNAIGMYDRVSGTFFTNSGTGDFVGGTSKGILQNTETTYVNSKNLYDVNNTLYGKYITDTGAIENSSGTGVKVSCVSNPIPVEIGKTYTFSGVTTTTTPATTNYVKVCCYTSDGTPVLINNNLLVNTAKTTGQPFSISFTIPNDDTIAYVRTSEWISDTFVQVEEGPRPTQYEVYGRNIIKPVDLWSTYQYLDAQNVSTGNLTRNTGVMIFDGTEDWTWTDNANAPIRLQISELAYVNSDTVAPIICSHFDSTYWNNLNATTKYTPYIAMTAATAPASKKIVFTAAWNPNMLNIDVWKAWLADQYKHGTPVMIIYPRLTPTDGNVYEGEDVVLTSSDSKIERDSAYINNLGIGVNYKKLK